MKKVVYGYDNFCSFYVIGKKCFVGLFGIVFQKIVEYYKQSFIEYVCGVGKIRMMREMFGVVEFLVSDILEGNKYFIRKWVG